MSRRPSTGAAMTGIIRSRAVTASLLAALGAAALATAALGQDGGISPLPPGGPDLFTVPEFDPEDFDRRMRERDAQEELGLTDEAEAEEPEPELTREERFDALFAELEEVETEDDAAFIAEEIEALWRDSGSATVDLLTDRATDALAMGEPEMARELIDGAIELGPEHAEAWAQSALIAMADEEIGVALEHIERAVSLEPRHYLAVTRLGLVLERLGQPAGAWDAYQRALELNPRLPAAVSGAERTEREGRGREL